MSPVQSLSDPSRIFAWCGTRFDGSGVDTLFALDRQLGDIVRTTAQPIVGQMRLTWWYEALGKLDTAPPPAQPLLCDVARQMLPQGVSGTSLGMMSEGWEILLDDERSDAASLMRYARLRGGTLFGAAGRLLDGEVPTIEPAGAVWALADLALNVSRDTLREQARAMALSLAREVFDGRWPRARTLGAVALDAQAAMMAKGVADGPRRAIAAARFRVSGR